MEMYHEIHSNNISYNKRERSVNKKRTGKIAFECEQKTASRGANLWVIKTSAEMIKRPSFNYQAFGISKS